MGRRRTWMLVLGIIAVVIAVPILIGGTAIAALFGPDGTLESGNEQLETPTRALVSAVAEISDVSPADRDLFGVRLLIELESADSGAVFVGVGRARDVSAYLDGVNVAQIDDIDFAPFRYTTVALEGERVPAPPGEQTFWVAKAEGTGPQKLDWGLRTGTYQVVVMNADASPGVDVHGSIGIKIPWIFWLGLGLLLFGLLLLVGGILFIVFGAKRRKLPPGQQPPYGAPPVGYVPAPAPGAPGYAQPTPGYGQPAPGYGQPTPGYGQPVAPPATTPPSGLPPGSPLPPPPPPSA